MTNKVTHRESRTEFKATRKGRTQSPLEKIWAGQPGRFFCISTKGHSGKWKDHFFARHQFDEIPDFIVKHRHEDVYWCPHGFNKELRRKEHAVASTLLWSDLDESDPRKLELRPTLAICSSPGRYVAVWKCDDETSEDINRQLTYAIGADRSGWDLTQVLRVPGSLNHKYEDTPEVKVLWDDGPSYSLAAVKRFLTSDGERAGSRDSVYQQYEQKMPHWLRRALSTDKPTVGKRSDMLWKMEHELLKIGCSTDETFELLKSSPWNKFRGRDHQLRREIEKLAGSTSPIAPPGAYYLAEPAQFATQSLAEVEEENIDWIWYPYLARGELTILEGDPGLGKSYISQIVSAALCDGTNLPSPRPREREPSAVVYFDIENARASVTKKRLKDMKRQDLFYQEETPFSMNDASSLAKVREALKRLKPDLVVFDTLNTYLGQVDTDNASSTTQALAVFRGIAKEFRCAVLLLRHLTKGARDKAIYRGQGSIAFVGVARLVIACGAILDGSATGAIALTKINIAKAPKPLTYTIEAKPTAADPDGSRFVWGEYIDLDAEKLIAGGGSAGAAPKEIADAIAFLEQNLLQGPKKTNELKPLASAKGLSWTTVKRAAKLLGVEYKVSGYGRNKQSVWTL